MKKKDTTTKVIAESETTKVIKVASNKTYIRITLFSIILMTSLLSVYTIISNPDFFDSALSFKTIEDEHAAQELIVLSEELALIENETSKIEESFDNAVNIANEISYDHRSSDIWLWESLLSSDRGSYMLDSDSAIEQQKINDISDLLKLNISFTFNKDSINDITDDDIEVNFIYNIFSPEIFDKKTFKLYSQHITFPKPIYNKLIDNIDNIDDMYDDNDVKKVIQTYVVENSADDFNGKSLLSMYYDLLDVELKRTLLVLEKQEEDFKKIEKSRLKIINRLRSNDYLFASVIFQKVMLSVLFVSIGLYFLRAIGSDLKFIRKLTIINLSQSISNESEGKNVSNSIDIYNSLIHHVEKNEKDPEIITVNKSTDIF